MTGETSLYRRHRPQTFDQVVGQEHVVRTLSNAVEHDRVHHAYLFVGSRGTGKTSLAKILARSLNCVKGPTTSPCGECESCVAITAGTSLDVIEMDAASNRSVDDIRELRERVGYVPAAGRWKSKRWQRSTIVGMTLCGSVVQSTKAVLRGGSSRVFRKAFQASRVSIWASSRM